MLPEAQLPTKKRLPLCCCGTDFTIKSYSTASHKPRGRLIRTYNKVAQNCGFVGILHYRKSNLNISALRLLMCVTDIVEYDAFFKEFNLPDSYNSWFRITELHMWMLLARLQHEGDEGKYMCSRLLTHMWVDVVERAKKLGGASKLRNQAIDHLYKQFYLAAFGYDEGLLGSDTALAGCLWRLFFEMNCEDATHMELLVHYVRKQIKHLDEQSSDIIFQNGLVTWLPLKSDQINKERTNQLLNTVCKRFT